MEKYCGISQKICYNVREGKNMFHVNAPAGPGNQRFSGLLPKPVHRGNTRCFRDVLLEYKSIIEKRTV